MRGSRRRFFVFLIIAVFILFSFSACNENSESEYANLEKLGLYEINKSVTPRIRGQVTLISNKIDTLNPLQTKNFYVSSFLNLVYEPLYKTTSKLANVPVLASSADSSNSNSTWTVYIDDSIKWHNGDLFTANDILHTFEILMNTQYDGPYKKNVSNIDSVTAEGGSVVFNLKEPDATFLYNLCVPIIPCSFSSSAALNKKMSNKMPIGTGPYVFSGKNKSGYILQRNASWHVADSLVDEYNGVRPPFIKTVNVNVYDNFSDSQSALLKNEIDIFPTDESSKQSLLKSTGFNISAIASNQFDCISVNNNSELFKDINVRRAFSCFIDRNDLIATCYKKRMMAAETAVLPSEKTWTHLSYSFSPKQAASYLEDSGWMRNSSYWTNKSGELFNVDLAVNASNTLHVKLAHRLAENLKQYGVNVYIKLLQKSAYRTALQEGKYEATFVGYSLSTDIDFSPYYSSKKLFGFLNYSNYSNKELDNLFAQWRAQTDDTSRANLYTKIKNTVLDEIPIIGISMSSTRILYSRRILGNLEPVNRFPYSNLAFCYIAK